MKTFEVAIAASQEHSAPAVWDKGKMVEDGPWTDYMDADGAKGFGGANDKQGTWWSLSG
jgi:hypothetical protein